jgi:predicted Zn-dependent protease
MLNRHLLLIPAFAVLLTADQMSGCEQAAKEFNLLPLEQDLQLGLEVEKEIAANPAQYPILPEKGNEEAYAFVRGIAKKILDSGQVKHKDQFNWTVRIIRDDKTLNAFCAPGGYIYVYTGLIKFLDTEDELAGVLGHEIAHADLRHSTRQLTKIMGLSLVAEALLGQQQQQLQQIATNLIALGFSRSHETESDMASVRYLCGTDYNAAGAAGFFRKMEGKPTPPEFLSTHPDPGNRVQKIDGEKTRLACAGPGVKDERMARIKRLLPN